MRDTKCERERSIEGGPLPRSFFARCATVVAPELLNCILVSVSPHGVTVGRIAETEAYTQDDAASHAHRGRTPRNEVMFGQAGHAYVYFTYGMHYCLNAVTGMEGQGEGVLIRSIEPLRGMELMYYRRGLSVEPEQLGERAIARSGRMLCGGPARLCKSLGVSAEHNGLDLTIGSSLWICSPTSESETQSGRAISIVSSPRIGITKAADLNRRFTIEADLFTSRGGKT